MQSDYITTEFGYLAEGQSVGGKICPECGGGRSRERSLRVSRYNGRLRAKCYRASCGWKYRGEQTAFVHNDYVHKPKELIPFAVVNNRPLKDEEKEQLSTKFSIEQGMFDWAKWTHVDDFDFNRGPRFVLPILRPDGTVRGKTYRSWDGHLPKAQINKLSDEDMICWYKPKPYGKVLIVVEDQPSALRAAGSGVDAVALCGTLLDNSRLAEIKRQGYACVWLCLDQDATVNAFQMLAEFKFRLPQLKIKTLDVDVKNMNVEQFNKFLEEIQ